MGCGLTAPSWKMGAAGCESKGLKVRMAIRLYNTLTRRKEEFQPFQPPQVGLYTCGPTVYNYAHIGNLRTYIFEDVLKRALRDTFGGFWRRG